MQTKYDFYAPEDYKNPDWDNIGRVHDWKNHIGEPVRELWESFSNEQKAAIAFGADDIAGQEEWD